MNTQPAAVKRTFAGLEVCRILCAFAVVIWHYQHFFFTGILTNPAPMAERLNFPFYRVFALLYNHGFFAVSIFWVISGFIFYWKYGDSIHTRATSAAKFGVLRFSRLYPLHLATLILVALLQLAYLRSHPSSFIYPTDPRHFVLQLCFASNWLNAHETFNGPVWSVSVEILIYALFFCLVYFVRPSIAQCVIAVGLAKLLLHLHVHSPLVACIEFFFAGGLLHRVDLAVRAEHRKVIFAGCAFAAAALLFVLHAHIIPLTQTVSLILAVLVVNSFILADEIFSFLHRIAWVGNLTYASYLIHFPIQLSLVIIFDALRIPRSLFLSPFAFTGFFAATFGLAWAVYYSYERGMQDMIRARWFGLDQRKAVAAAESAVPS